MSQSRRAQRRESSRSGSIVARGEPGNHSFRERVSSIRHLFPSFYFFLDFRYIMVGVSGRNIDTRIGAGDIVVSFAAVLCNGGCIGEVARNSTALDGRM